MAVLTLTPIDPDICCSLCRRHERATDARAFEVRVDDSDPFELCVECSAKLVSDPAPIMRSLSAMGFLSMWDVEEGSKLGL